MVLPQFEYLAPKTIGEACNLFLELGSTARVMAGATDLIPPMKDKVISPEYIIDLKKIPGLDYLEYDDREGLKIGALTTLRTIETSPLVKEKNPAVAHAAKVVASTQIRTKGTMAGNICNASPSCDTAPNLLAQGAKILVQGPNKDRVIQIEDFFLGVKKTSLEPGEIVTGIILPALTTTMVTVLILNIGFFMNAGLDQVLNFTNPAVNSEIDIIDTYVYRIGLQNSQYSFATAANLFKGIVGTVLIITTHLTSKKLTGKGAW